MANNATKFGTVALGSAIAGALITLVVNNSLITRGNIVLDSTDNQTQAIQTTNNGTLTNVLEFSSGSTNVRARGYVTGSGAQVTLFGALTLTEVNGYASGALAITNPFSDPLLCYPPVFDVTTASSPVARVDVFGGTGSIGSMGPNNSGTLAVHENIGLTAAVWTLSGSGIRDAASNPKHFKLFPTTSTTQVNRINVVSDTQSGSGLVGTYAVDCKIDG